MLKLITKINLKHIKFLLDPNNATKLEMFALCSYADQMGMGDKSTFGTYQTLLGFEKMSIHNGFFNGKVVEEPAWDMFISAKLDWENAFYKVKDLLYKCNDLGQYSKSLSILDLFSKYPVK